MEKLLPPKRKNRLIRILSYNLSLGKYKELFFENIVMMISSGIGVLPAIEEFRKDNEIKALDYTLENIVFALKNGQQFWEALAENKILDGNMLDIVRVGEQSGNLVQNLQIVLEQKRKDKDIQSKIVTASLYPMIILIVMVVVGSIIALFVLPRLTEVYSAFNTDLPPITQFLIDVGKFMEAHGTVVVPSTVIGILATVFLIFFYSKTKFIGQAILLRLPVIKVAITQLEMARFGNLMSSLLGSGFRLLEAMDIITKSSQLFAYRNTYKHIADSISNGESISQVFATTPKIKRYFPLYVRQALISGEQTGKLKNSFKQIGDTYQKEYDHTTANLYVMLEPILLILVWIGVFGVAIAVILPIYNLIGSFSSINESPEAQTSAPVIKNPALVELRSDGRQTIPIYNRKGGDIILKVKSGDTYEYKTRDTNGYEIIMKDGSIGWVEAIYAVEK